MAKRVKPRRAATPEDLESLVRALGGLVRESVRDEVRMALRPLVGVSETDGVVAVIHQLISEQRKMREDLDRMEGCIRDLQKLTDAALALERQRLAKERDLEHRAFLGKVDLARHPERVANGEATPEQLRNAQDIANAFASGSTAATEGLARDAERARPLPDNRAEGRPPMQPGETPAFVDGQVVKR